jgi:hypothetical protein
MTTELLVKLIGDVIAAAVLLWMVIMFQKGEIISRVTVERIIQDVTSRTVAETSARIITAVDELVKEHSTATHAEHQALSDKLTAHDVHATKVERDVEEFQRDLRGKR